MGSKIQEWTTFLNRSLHSRLSVKKFESFAKLLKDKSPVHAVPLAHVFLAPKSHVPGSVDPLLPLYVEALIRCDLIGASHVLDALLRYSRLRPSRGPTGATSERDDGHLAGGINAPELEEVLLLGIARMFSVGEQPKHPSEVLQVLRAVARWMSAVVTRSTTDEMMQHVTGEANHLSAESLSMREAIGMLAVAIVENSKVSALLTGSYPKDVTDALAQALSSFIPLISRTSLQIASRLETFQRQYDLYEGSHGKDMDKIIDGVNAESLQLDALADLSDLDDQALNSRAGPYILLSALLVARPAVHDSLLLNHFYSRYKGNISTLTTDLTVASFDILSNAAFRNEHQQTLFLLRSFLINKVPLLLTELSTSMFPPLTPEYCIAQALNHVDSQAFPSFSSMFDVSTDSGILSEVRQEFLFACCLHNLIPESSIEPLLGEIPMQELPPGGKFSKELLVSQCMNDPGRIESLLGEIEGMEGNAGAVVEAIAEVMRNMCTDKETVPLKSVCTSLAQKPSSLDVMLLFVSPATLLLPICDLLDSWRYEEDQGEYQPVYEEYGCILLLVLAFVHRYDLTALDLGITNGESFVAQLLDKGHTSVLIDELSEEKNRQLDGWIRGLFEADNGISDELMSSCRPQDFYMLVPTLFSQSILACQANVMSVETLRGGLEYVLETFLLPSLVGAIIWLTQRMWETAQGTSEVLMHVLQTLIKPPSISGEAAMVHGVVLSMVGSALESALGEVRRREGAVRSSSELVDSLLQTLKPHLSFKRTTASPQREVESWTPAQVGGLTGSLRNTFQSLVLWSTTPDINMTPASYTHRQLLVATQVLGARLVLRAIVDELKLQSQNGSGGLALDIATTLVCAPTVVGDDDLLLLGTTTTTTATRAPPPPPRRRRLTLRDCLKLEHDELVPLISTTDPVRAESIVRLHRRVEAHCQGVIAAAAAGTSGVGGAAAGVGVVPTTTITATTTAAAAAAGVGVAAVQAEEDVDMMQMQEDLDVAVVAAAGMGVWSV